MPGHSRRFDLLYTGLGLDPTGITPDLSDTIAPTYLLDDLSYALPNRVTTQCYMNCAPSAALAEFSAFEFTTPNGVWVRRACLLSGSNIVWKLDSQIATLITTFDPLPQIVVGSPEGGVHRPETLGAGFLTDSVTPTTGRTRLFTSFLMGHGAVQLAGVFSPVNVSRDFITDLWVEPGTTIKFCAIAANTVISVALSLEYPAGVTLYP